MGSIVVLFFVVVGGCWMIGKGIGNALFPDRDNTKKYVDNSTTIVHHHHYHDNRSVHVDGKQFKDLKK